MAPALPNLNQPISMLGEYVASQPKTLRFKNHAFGGSTITDISNNPEQPKKLFSIDAKTPGMSAAKRVFHDAEGKVLFEMRRNWTSQDSTLTLSGEGSPRLALFAPRLSCLKDSLDVFVSSEKGKDDDILEVRGQDIWKKNTCVYRGEDLVMQVRSVNAATFYLPCVSNEWDAHIAQGMDLSLASAIVAYLAATLYDSPYFASNGVKNAANAIGVDCNIKVAADYQVPGRDMAVVATAHGSSAIELLRLQTTLK